MKVYIDGQLLISAKDITVSQWFKELGTNKIRHLAVTSDGC